MTDNNQKKWVKREEKPKTKTQLLAPSYYARKEIQKAMFEFCKNRETVANFNNDYFAKRPDCFDYPSDVAIAARKGATSFHTSEELWDDPMNINVNFSKEEYNNIRIGWDFLIDIDSKYLDYSKIAARLLIEELERHGVTNYGIKFSGSKGFHIIVPFNSFPNTFSGQATKDMFPEWPRHIANYLFNRIKGPMNQEIMRLTSREKLEEKGELISEHKCPRCGSRTEKKMIGIYKCPNFSCRAEVKSMKSNRKEMMCPGCNGKMQREHEEEIHFCSSCNTNSATLAAQDESSEAERFTEEITTKSAEDSVDVVLVSSRHLFRAPYSLHEKTGFASIVLLKEEVEDFKPTDADPLKIREPRSFMPEVNSDEARDLLFYALENVKVEPEKTKKYEGSSIDLKGLTITEDMFPPVIKTIQKGIQGDGRKRALYILLSFYNSLEFPQDYIEEKVGDWNKKNKIPLKDGYVKSQTLWSARRKILPPNYTNPVYKEFGIQGPPEPGMKNPINYTIKKALKQKSKDAYKKREEDKNPSIV